MTTSSRARSIPRSTGILLTILALVSIVSGRSASARAPKPRTETRPYVLPAPFFDFGGHLGLCSNGVGCVRVVLQDGDRWAEIEAVDRTGQTLYGWVVGVGELGIDVVDDFCGASDYRMDIQGYDVLQVSLHPSFDCSPTGTVPVAGDVTFRIGK